MDTAHDRYTAQVETLPQDTTWRQPDDKRLNFQNAQRAAIIAERDALRRQVAALVEERDLLLALVAELKQVEKDLTAEIDELRTANTDPFDLATLDTGDSDEACCRTGCHAIGTEYRLKPWGAVLLCAEHAQEEEAQP